MLMNKSNDKVCPEDNGKYDAPNRINRESVATIDI
jgi:hypothetical protein